MSSSGKQNRGRQRLVRYLGAGSYRRFSPEKGKDVSISAKAWMILVAVGTVLLILAGVWQEARQLGGRPGSGAPAAATGARH